MGEKREEEEGRKKGEERKRREIGNGEKEGRKKRNIGRGDREKEWWDEGREGRKGGGG